MLRRATLAFAVTLCAAAAILEAPVSHADVPEHLYTGELVSYPGPWSFQLGRSSIILVSDRELEMLENPDTVLNLTLTFDKAEASLRQVCERAKAAGHRTLIIAFDHFFSQYRPGQAGPRKLMPDMDEYVRRIAAIGKFAAQYGLGLELSLLNPLEIGKAYSQQTGESGVWLHYRKGLRNPATGAYSVELWRQQRWANNKGPFEVEDAGVRVFAFRERAIPGTPYRVVDPAGIVEVTDTARVEVMAGAPDAEAARVRIHGQGRAGIGPLDRVLVVQQYRTPEMDYFSDKALPYLQKLVDKYADAGVKLNALYSDEAHIQQDWGYFTHHDHGQFAMRYVSPGLSRRFAELYGAEYADLGKYLVYFAYGQEDFANDMSAGKGVMHVFGASPEEIRRTALFRSRYYRLLQDGVVDLFAAAKRHAEKRMGHRLEARAHATWAESPTIDYWDTGPRNEWSQKYEYTANFVWSNTVHQAAAACHDYFKWGDFLTGNGNDHCECGWLDRNYVGLALACSTGILNEVPYSYGAHWGMPDEISRRRTAVQNVFGAAGSPLFGIVQDMQHRDVDVLMLYPLDLVAVEERFGSWMNQYAYANQVTAAKLLERGKAAKGAIEMAGRRFTTLVAAFEPFPSRRLLALMRDLVESGGRVVWSGPPPLLSSEGEPILAEWQTLFGVTYAPTQSDGLPAPGRLVSFEGALAAVPSQTILTDFLVDRVYAVTPGADAAPAARCEGVIVGTHRKADGGGQAVFLGFRPRDDQSASLGYETRTWFETLRALGAYPGSAPGVDDNTELVSRNTSVIACRFPNGAVAVAPHLKAVEEAWPGGFARDRAQDAEYLKRVPPPSDALELKGFRVGGHEVTYAGTQAMAFRVDAGGRLVAFAGSGARSITIDGRETVFADAPVGQAAWAPVPEGRRVPGGAVLQALTYTATTLRIPVPGQTEPLEVWAEGALPGSRGTQLEARVENETLVVAVPAPLAGRWLYAAPRRSG